MCASRRVRRGAPGSRGVRDRRARAPTPLRRGVFGFRTCRDRHRSKAVRRGFRVADGRIAHSAPHGRVHDPASCAAIRARGLIALGRFDEAVAASSYDQKSLIRAMRGELRATKALAAACGGRHQAARTLSRSAQELSGTVEVPVIAASVDAIALCDAEDASADAACTAAARLARHSGYVDGLIAAYRGFPEFARRIAAGEERLWFAGLLKRACDGEIAQVAGLGVRLGENRVSRGGRPKFSRCCDSECRTKRSPPNSSSLRAQRKFTYDTFLRNRTSARAPRQF